jgi:hypothetical protein
MFLAEPPRVRRAEELRHIRYLESVCQDADRRKEANLRRIELKPNEAVYPKQVEIDEIQSQIQTLQIEMQKLGEEGKVDQSQGLMKLVEELLAKQKVLELDRPVWMVDHSSQDIKQVCDVCGVFTESKVRDESHLVGKQHLGFAKIRATIRELQEAHRDPIPAPTGGKVERGEVLKERERESRDRRRSASPRRDRDRRSRSRGRDRSRSRRSRSRDRRDRSRERERRRDRSR